MADEDKQVPPETPKEDKPKETKTETVDKEWAEVVGNKFSSPTEVAKAYKELEKKYGEQSTEVKQAREVMSQVTPILNAIQDDPELFKRLEAKFKEPDSTTADKPEAPAEKSQSDVRQVTSNLILAKFEEKHGFDKMESDERREIRQHIGDAIYELTGKNLNSVDLRKLETTLENAYIIAKYKSKSAGSDEAEDRASISSVPSKAGKTETTLTPEEASIAQKMGLTREQYLEGKKKLTK